MALAISALIPLRDRPTVAVAARSLLQAGVRDLLIVDAASRDAATCAALRDLQKDARVRIVTTNPPFHRARLLNEGLRRVRGGLVLTSDADVVWTRDAVVALGEQALRAQSIVHVARVRERQPLTGASARRLRCDLSSPGIVRILIDRRGARHRPGYGLLMARRSSMLRVGGWCETLKHWGWEDLDLLTRAHAFGIDVRSAGTVVHLTHDDDVRDLVPGVTRVESRNSNVLRALASYRQGTFYGALGKCARGAGEPHLEVTVTRGAQRELRCER